MEQTTWSCEGQTYVQYCKTCPETCQVGREGEREGGRKGEGEREGGGREGGRGRGREGGTEGRGEGEGGKDVFTALSLCHRLISVIESMDNGKPIRESRDLDIPLVARHFYHHAGTR